MQPILADDPISVPLGQSNSMISLGSSHDDR